MKDFSGKVAVITGGASGIGKAIGLKLGQRGSKIVLADVEQSALDRAIDDLRREDIDAIGYVTDVSKIDAVESLAKRSFEHFGAVHLLFNNAGVAAGEDAELWNTPFNDLVWLFGVNWWGVVHGVRAFMPLLVAQNEEAHVVNTISGAGLLTLPSTATYSATKAAVLAYTEALHFQLQAANSPVKASLLIPGPHTIATGIYSAARNKPPELQGDEPPVLGSIEALQDMIEAATGKRLEVTSSEELADVTLEAIRRDQFWISPQNEKFVKALRLKVENIVGQRTPDLPDVF
jgi:NAD(P)-dependent dehydrogenase (short-subunit alcohol dehydrogenase family)